MKFQVHKEIIRFSVQGKFNLCFSFLGLCAPFKWLLVNGKRLHKRGQSKNLTRGVVMKFKFDNFRFQIFKSWHLCKLSVILYISCQSVSLSVSQSVGQSISFLVRQSSSQSCNLAQTSPFFGCGKSIHFCAVLYQFA